MNKRMLELYQQAHVDYTAIDPSNNMPYKSACFSADRFAELIVRECVKVSIDHQCFPKDHLTLEEAFISGQEHSVRCINQHFGIGVIDMRYEQDDGALTDDQIRYIRAASSATNIPEERFTESLFNE